jgi:hypothetical protein
MLNKLNVKEIMNSPVCKIDKPKVNVSANFQKLDYLKHVPKRIDCWLSKDQTRPNSGSRTSNNKSALKRKNKKSLKTSRKESPTAEFMSKKFDNFSDFNQSGIYKPADFHDKSSVLK